MTGAPLIAIVAGEASGDLLGAGFGTAVAIDQLLGGYHNYGGGGASYAIYDSSDPFNLTGTTVTLAP